MKSKQQIRISQGLRLSWMARKAKRLHCDRCNAPCEPFDPAWRYCDGIWQHKCPDLNPQCGHIGMGTDHKE